MSMDMNKMLQQFQQMQADMLKAQEELAGERVEASVGGGMVTVTASGSGEIVGVNDGHTAGCEQPRHGALAARDASGEPDVQGHETGRNSPR